jgi:hypothetical protein
MDLAYHQNQNLAKSTANNFFEMKRKSRAEYNKLWEIQKRGAKAALLALLPHLVPPDDRIILILKNGFEGLDCSDRINGEKLNILVKKIFDGYLEWIRSIPYMGSTYYNQVIKEENTARLILEYAISNAKLEYEVCQNGSTDSFIRAFIEWVIANIVTQYETLQTSDYAQRKIKSIKELIAKLPVPTPRAKPQIPPLPPSLSPSPSPSPSRSSSSSHSPSPPSSPPPQMFPIPQEVSPPEPGQEPVLQFVAPHLNPWAQSFHGPWANWEHNMAQPRLRSELLARLNELTHRDGSEGRALIQMQVVNEEQIPTRVIKKRVEYLERRKREMGPAWGSIAQPRTRNRKSKKSRKGRKTRKTRKI